MDKIEDIILRYSGRGMNIVRQYLPQDYCMQAAKEIISWKRGTVILTTGFYVGGYAETDGPAGTVFLAKALHCLGFQPVILTDKYCKSFFEEEGIGVEYVPIGDEAPAYMDDVVIKYQPVGLISIERCGRNKEGKYLNMRGVDISDWTATIDDLFQKEKYPIPSVGVGDGGNEIGMGKLKKVISEKLSLEPCVVQTDYLVVASVSNWGAYGLIACLALLSAKELVPDYRDVLRYIRKTVEMGSVDGVRKENIAMVDGFELEVEQEIIESLSEAVKSLK